MATAEANYGRADESLRYVLNIARQLDLEQPGALPEQMPSPDYIMFPFQPLIRRAMVMQAWASYGVVYPIVSSFLGIQPHLPQGFVKVVPQLPRSLPHLSIENLPIGDKILAVAAQRSNELYVTEVALPAGCRLEIGHALETGISLESVILNGEATDYEVRSTSTGTRCAHCSAEII